MKINVLELIRYSFLLLKLLNMVNTTTIDSLIYSNTTNTTISIIDDTYHTQNLSLIIITMILFFGFSYYLYYTAKHGINNARNSNSETSALHSKYEIIKSFSTAFASIIFLN
jgi:hypothetical protein